MVTLFEFLNIPFRPFHGLCKLTNMPHRIADTHLNLCLVIFPPAIWYSKAQSIHSDWQSLERDSSLSSVGAPELFDKCDGVTSIVLLNPFSESRSPGQPTQKTTRLYHTYLRFVYNRLQHGHILWRVNPNDQ